MNNVCLVGRLARDVELSYRGREQVAVATFPLAVSRFDKDKGADFPRIVVFGKQAENAEKYLSKGKQVAVTGRIQTGSYEGRDGKKVYTTDIVASTVEYLTPKSTGTSNEQDMPPESYDGFQSVDDDIPF
ncbi:MAG: single-stranded DNA-binding protein [Bacillota bacterium]|nr:single-stranded DNA-binding protein [Bacillota bacterium]